MWVKFDSWRVDPTAEIPHGIRYSLTLHDRFNHRILGYDNAHFPDLSPQSRKKLGGAGGS